MNQIGPALADQFDRVWHQVRETIEHCTDAEWKRGDHPFFIPVRLACHLVETVDFYTSASPEGFDWGGQWGGVDCEGGDIALLPRREALLVYVDVLQPRVDGWLGSLSDDALLGENAFPWTGPNVLARMVYLLRHCQHHIGEINEELTRRGLPPADWR